MPTITEPTLTAPVSISRRPADAPLDAGVLDRNLGALGVKQPELASLLAATHPASVEWVDTPEGFSAAYQGRALGSKRQPITEGRAAAGALDPMKHTSAVVMGFGLGYHVAALIARQAEGDACLVFEPDVPLLRAVLERIDHSALLASKGLYLLVDPSSEAELARAAMSLTRALSGGVQVIDHAPSLPRLAPHRRAIAQQIATTTSVVRLNVVSELVQTEATFRNLLFNIDHYATCPPFAALHGALAGRVAITVAAGPSLARNIDQLARPGVRERCVIIAAQTVLRPLLARGIKPHFVTALDHHEISARFYEGLTRELLEGVTLICEAKVNPAVPAAFAGRIVMPADFVLDRMLTSHGPQGPTPPREMGSVSAGTTVAHLSYYVARALGCRTVALVGQDLGFTDGQYYAAGAAIHRAWAGELGEFNTLEMLEWQRIKRMGPALRSATDHLGRRVYTDDQMNSYLQQFLRDFLADAARGLITIDATEGGVRKDHTTARPLREVIDEALGAGGTTGTGAEDIETTDQVIDRCLAPHAPEAALNSTNPGGAGSVIGQLKISLAGLKVGLGQIGSLAGKARAMLAHARDNPTDTALLDRTTRELDIMAQQVVTIEPAWTVINVFNITAAFRRWKADRAIALAKDLPASAVQARRLARDLVNVELLEDASARLAALVAGTQAMLEGGPRQTRDLAAKAPALDGPQDVAHNVSITRGAVRTLAAACVPLGTTATDWLGRPASAAAASLTIQGHPLIRLAVTRLLAASPEAGGPDAIALTTDEPAALRALLGPLANDPRVHVTPATDSDELAPGLPPRVIGAARLFNRSCWRGGLANLTCYDEALNPAAAARALHNHGAHAALVFGPSWALIDPAITVGLIARHREDPEAYRLVFSQATPGLAPCLLARASLDQLAKLRPEAGVLASVGGLTGYIPSAPRPDDLGRAPCLAISPLVRDALHRCAVDGPHSAAWIGAALDSAGLNALTASAEQISAATAARSASIGLPGPWHLRLTAPSATQIARDTTLPARALALASRHLAHAAATADALAVTIQIAHEDHHHSAPHHAPEHLAAHGQLLAELVAAAHRSGAASVHLRAPLAMPAGTLAWLTDATPGVQGVDVLSLDIPTMTPATLETLGLAGAGAGPALHERLAHAWRTIMDATASTPGVVGLRTPWVVPRMTRRDEVYSEIDGFYDHWLSVQGACVIDALPGPIQGARIAPLPVPELARLREAREARTIDLARDSSNDRAAAGALA